MVLLFSQGKFVKGFDFEKFPPAMPEQIAQVVLFLARQESSGYINGQVLIADGGMSNSMGMSVAVKKEPKKKDAGADDDDEKRRVAMEEKKKWGLAKKL